MRYCPPYTFPHRVYYAKQDKRRSAEEITEVFGKGGTFPGLTDRWQEGIDPAFLRNNGGVNDYYGAYVAFRKEDDQMLFYMKFAGKKYAI